MSDRHENPPLDGEASPELLPNELLWAEGGHASDIALTALADGQLAILPPSVLAHVERCTPCATHLGHAALLSLHAGAELAAKVEHERVTARRPLPRLAIGLGLFVALIGLVPSILDGTSHAYARDLPLFAHGLRTLAHRLDAPGSVVGLFVTYAAASLLVLMGIAVVRILPKAQKETPR
jgi:hypothetical protein